MLSRHSRCICSCFLLFPPFCRVIHLLSGSPRDILPSGQSGYLWPRFRVIRVFHCKYLLVCVDSDSLNTRSCSYFGIIFIFLLARETCRQCVVSFGLMRALEAIYHLQSKALISCSLSTRNARTSGRCQHFLSLFLNICFSGVKKSIQKRFDIKGDVTLILGQYILLGDEPLSCIKDSEVITYVLFVSKISLFIFIFRVSRNLPQRVATKRVKGIDCCDACDYFDVFDIRRGLDSCRSQNWYVKLITVYYIYHSCVLGPPMPGRRPASRAPKACTHCVKQKARCDENRPCARCSRIGHDDCVDRR